MSGVSGDPRLEAHLSPADRAATRDERRRRAARNMILAIALFALCSAIRAIGC